VDIEAAIAVSKKSHTQKQNFYADSNIEHRHRPTWYGHIQLDHRLALQKSFQGPHK
jgi:hypothetical protein